MGIPLVNAFKIKKTLLGSYQVVFDCPHCQSELHSKESEIGEQDWCPDCKQPFRLSPKAIAEIESLREQALIEKNRKSEEKEACAESSVVDIPAKTRPVKSEIHTAKKPPKPTIATNKKESKDNAGLYKRLTNAVSYKAVNTVMFGVVILLLFMNGGNTNVDMHGIESQLSEIQAELVEINNNTNSIQSDVDSIQSDVDSIDSGVALIRSGVNSIQSDVDSIKSGVVGFNSIKSDVDSIQSDVSSIESDVSAIKRNQR